MHMVKLLAALGALSFSTLANAQAHLECGSIACGSHSNAAYGGATGINDLNVGGDLFDVNFTATAPATSPFVLSDSTAAPGQPLTGIDAGNAIAAFYGSLLSPYGGYPIAGDPGPAFITAFGPAGSLSSGYLPPGFPPLTEIYDIVSTTPGVVYSGHVGAASSFATTYFFLSPIGPTPIPGSPVDYTTWTPIAALAAPEIDPVSAVSAMTLVLGALAVLRSRKRPG